MTKDIYGLVLAGGKSQRMGKDKGSIEWFDKPQRYYLADLLKGYCDKVYISCRPDQAENIKSYHDQVIIDKAEYNDSYGAIISALNEFPIKAFLVVACDMPFVDGKAIENLVNNRDQTKIATAYFNPENNLPEPMLAIWEPRALKRLKQLTEQGINCPRKALIKSKEDTKLIRPLDDKSIININTPEDADKARKVLDECR